MKQKSRTTRPQQAARSPNGAIMDMFSPDGTKLAFNDFAAREVRGLATMTYDTAAHTLSAYKVVFTGKHVSF